MLFTGTNQTEGPPFLRYTDRSQDFLHSTPKRGHSKCKISEIEALLCWSTEETLNLVGEDPGVALLVQSSFYRNPLRLVAPPSPLT